MRIKNAFTYNLLYNKIYVSHIYLRSIKFLLLAWCKYPCDLYTNFNTLKTCVLTFLNYLFASEERQTIVVVGVVVVRAPVVVDIAKVVSVVGVHRALPPVVSRAYDTFPYILL
jgi:hypothetical protein